MISNLKGPIFPTQRPTGIQPSSLIQPLPVIDIEKLVEEEKLNSCAFSDLDMECNPHWGSRINVFFRIYNEFIKSMFRRAKKEGVL
jgi:hypothetical protein